MRNQYPKFFAFALAFSLNCSAQSSDDTASNTKSETPQLEISANSPEADANIIGYHIEERKNSQIGSHITTYTVSHISLVPTRKLGPYDSRTVKPIYGNGKK